MDLPKSPKKILDAGCGASLLPSFLASKGYDVTAIDRWAGTDRSCEGCLEEALEIREKSKQKYIIIVGDLLKLPFMEREFDITICNSTIEHIPDDISAVKELARVTKDLLFITFPTAQNATKYDGRTRSYSVNATIRQIVIPIIESGFKLIPAHIFEYDGKILFKRAGNETK
ncbi:MAG: class I SAM-dependent methyltransferase [Patescibacteria group bacterium]